MSLDIRLPSPGKTADKIVLSSLLLATSYQARITIPSSKPTSETWPVSVEDLIEEAEEREWDTLFAQPHVQAGLERLAEEAERQFAAGEIEEGGFAVE
jgi:hypothetical protein